MRSKVWTVEVSGGCSTDFSEISTFLARSTGDNSYCPYYPYCPYYLLYAEPPCTSLVGYASFK